MCEDVWAAGDFVAHSLFLAAHYGFAPLAAKRMWPFPPSTHYMVHHYKIILRGLCIWK